MKKIIIIKKSFCHIKKKQFFLSKHIIMVYLTTDELRETTKKRGIRDYEKMPRGELLRTFDESECFIKNLLQNV